MPVNKREETSTVTWYVRHHGHGIPKTHSLWALASFFISFSFVRFTDERVKEIKTGPWLPSEDRVLLQAQLCVEKKRMDTETKTERKRRQRLRCDQKEDREQKTDMTALC